MDAWSETLRRQTREHPGRSVALALGAGYVLGGGLFTVLTARLLGAAVRIGVRVAVVPLVTDSIAALGGGLMGQGDAIVTRERHRKALERAHAALDRARTMLVTRGPLELAAEEVRLAARAIGEITGRVDVEDVLDRLLSSFCIGK